jgi:circadian clock protein KaiB
MTEQPNSPFNNDDLTNGDYRLRLYVTGATPNSARAIVNLKEFCETHLKDKYELEIIDVYQQPLSAEADQVIAIPMLIKLAPLPQRRLIGDMSDREKIFKGLNLAAGD